MRRSRFLDTVRSDGVARITCLYHPIDMFCRHAANAGYDAVWIEAEHHMWESREIQRMLYLGGLADIDVIVRPSTVERAGLYQYLEQGASGLIIPQVRNGEEARALVEAAKFPPLGTRGLDGASIDCDFYLGIGPEYTTGANENIVLILQIENLDGLENAEAIAATPGVDGLFIGQGDMSLRLGCNPDPREPKLVEVDRKVAAVCKKHGKFWGRPCVDAADIQTVVGLGAGFVNYGSDFMALLNSIAEYGRVLDEQLGGEASQAHRS